MNLLEQKQKLEVQVKTLEERIKTNHEVASQKREGSGEDDIASLYEMQAKAHAAIQLDKTMLTNTNVAIRRIESGDYLYCAPCGEEIDPRRLIANPVAKTCIDCANAAFHKQKHMA